MRKVLSILAFCILNALFLIPDCFAQAPKAIPYQAVARDNNGNPIVNQLISLRFSIIDSAAGGAVVYVETDTVTTNEFGLFTLKIGYGSIASTSPGPFNISQWNKSATYMKTELDVNGGTSYVDMGTEQILSVPYALYADSVGYTGAVTYKGTWDAVNNVPHLSSSVGTNGDYYVVSNASPVLAQNTELNGNRKYLIGDAVIYNQGIYMRLKTSDVPVSGAEVTFTPGTTITATNVQGAIDELSSKVLSTFGSVNYAGTWNASANDPVLNSSVGTKGFYYVVTIAGNASSNTNLNGITDWNVGDWAIYNGTIWEKVDNSQSPVVASGIGFTPNSVVTSTNVQEAIDEVYTDLDAQVSSKVSKAGDTMTGSLILNADPITALGAATKKYVDDHATSIVPNGTAIGQTLHWNGAAWVADSGIYSNGKRIGIGTTTPDAPLSITEDENDHSVLSVIPRDITKNPLKIAFRTSSTGSSGLDIAEETTTGSRSRLFIQEETGYVGLGTISPSQMLQLQGHYEDDHGLLGLKTYNESVTYNRGWSIGHLHDDIEAKRNGAFSFFENGDIPTQQDERVVILPGGNVGINESMPSTKLHVSRPLSDPLAAISLLEGTGNIVIGPITDNIVADYRGIQARTGSYDVTGLSLSASTLNLQRLGGDLLVHGSSAASSRVLITDAGFVGLGKTPIEKLDIGGAIIIGNSVSAENGTIRYTGTDFEGRKGGAWVSLTQGSVSDGFISSGAGTIYYDAVGTTPKVGIGLSTPFSMLHVSEHSSVSSDNTSVIIENTSSNSSTNAYTRAGLQISCTGTWSSSTAAKNIGLHISDVSGQNSHNSNIAALINGNVVVGSLISSQMIGTNGVNVLAIQNGDAPSSAISSDLGTAEGGIQLYSSSDVSGASVFHVMNGNGDIIKLYRSPAITTPDNSTVGTSYGSNEAGVINNMRDRINQLEQILKAHGLLEP